MSTEPVVIVNGQQSGVYDVELWEWQSRAKGILVQTDSWDLMDPQGI